jgi:hypothetical protein
VFRRKQQEKPTKDSAPDPLSQLVKVIASKRHWVMYTAAFSTVDQAVSALGQLSFFKDGRFTGDIEGAVAGGPGEATVLLGGELMADQMGEVQFLLSTKARTFDMRWDRTDEVTEGRVRRSVEFEPAQGAHGPGRGGKA